MFCERLIIVMFSFVQKRGYICLVEVLFPPTLNVCHVQKMRKLILVCHHNLYVNKLVGYFQTSRKEWHK